MSKEEIEYYERELNLERYGVRELGGRIAVAVACEIAKRLDDETKASLSPMAQKWLAIHAAEDDGRDLEAKPPCSGCAVLVESLTSLRRLGAEPRVRPDLRCSRCGTRVEVSLARAIAAEPRP